MLEDIVFFLRGAMDGQPFRIRFEAGDSFRKVFREEKLACMSDVSAGVLCRSRSSDMRFDVDVNGPSGVPAGVNG